MTARGGRDLEVAIVGAGAGGLAAAIDLAAAGCRVTVFEKARQPGGKMRTVNVAGETIDAGPTVFTMRWVFDGLFEAAGTRLEENLSLKPAELLARHAWTGGGRLDLFADPARSADAIGDFAGARDAAGYRAFCRDGEAVYRAFRESFIAAERPSQLDLVRRMGLTGLGPLLRARPWSSLWSKLGGYFHDPRLRQLFARYATYVGSSPFACPATLMLIAHVEQSGVWLIDGGMSALAKALGDLGARLGVAFRFDAEVARIETVTGRVSALRLHDGTRIETDAVIFNGDASALGAGLLGSDVQSSAPAIRPEARSLSAVTWCMKAETAGFPLAHHTVFFAEQYATEFEAIFRHGRIAEQPTVYICAQDRPASGTLGGNAAERLFVLVNAPADGDRNSWPWDAVEDVAGKASGVLQRCGLSVEFPEAATVATTPSDFDRLFPGSGGALYGRASHGAAASFERAGAATPVGGLYLAGGSVHPGAGVPMAALSGRLAAARLLAEIKG